MLAVKEVGGANGVHLVGRKGEQRLAGFGSSDVPHPQGRTTGASPGHRSASRQLRGRSRHTDRSAGHRPARPRSSAPDRRGLEHALSATVRPARHEARPRGFRSSDRMMNSNTRVGRLALFAPDSALVGQPSAADNGALVESLCPRARVQYHRPRRNGAAAHPPGWAPGHEADDHVEADDVRHRARGSVSGRALVSRRGETDSRPPDRRPPACVMSRHADRALSMIGQEGAVGSRSPKADAASRHGREGAFGERARLDRRVGAGRTACVADRRLTSRRTFAWVEAWRPQPARTTAGPDAAAQKVEDRVVAGANRGRPRALRETAEP